MKTQRFTLALTAVNLVILLTVIFLISTASKSKVTDVVRAGAFELVDGQGRVRAEIKILPAEPDFIMPDGTKGAPETVIFRLIDSQGGPNVKIAATSDGSGMVLGGDSGYIQVNSRSKSPFIKLSAKNGKEQVIDLEQKN